MAIDMSSFLASKILINFNQQKISKLVHRKNEHIQADPFPVFMQNAEYILFKCYYVHFDSMDFWSSLNREFGSVRLKLNYLWMAACLENSIQLAQNIFTKWPKLFSYTWSGRYQSEISTKNRRKKNRRR